MKLNYKRTFFIGLAFMSICAFWQLYDYVIPYILKYTFGVEEGLTGVIMAADNVLAVFLLPVFGALSDRVKTPLGRRTPFILFVPRTLADKTKRNGFFPFLFSSF
jgi:Na+/melibiose symporter-like transporter